MVVLFVCFETKRFDFKSFCFSLIEPTYILPRGLLPPNFFAMLEIRSPSLPEGGFTTCFGFTSIFVLPNAKGEKLVK